MKNKEFATISLVLVMVLALGNPAFEALFERFGFVRSTPAPIVPKNTIKNNLNARANSGNETSSGSIQTGEATATVSLTTTTNEDIEEVVMISASPTPEITVSPETPTGVQVAITPETDRPSLIASILARPIFRWFSF
ncbi:MAG: hypothetical protein COV31_01975 [Candidatus Yanofskybacteria bacterium CG10_big_fil_rev_8_21_14_0_10_46_23]|uniref:Uncharacterized protein n=1 Tax=Candidatus Yanofskybacteria bacterium CG10_big_fil_rev_8_21_14_0_10_46_23 TaxID=1975098 RepID=A0A2H0R3R6_9BACT|nr:MAG: hypothetical protein COV31_01975 [Candidatus Yanofskybacteria bacterium CG10_big_fil_rev_8_21_14_0_10_46_23]